MQTSARDWKGRGRGAPGGGGAERLFFLGAPSSPPAVPSPRDRESPGFSTKGRGRDRVLRRSRCRDPKGGRPKEGAAGLPYLRRRRRSVGPGCRTNSRRPTGPRCGTRRGPRPVPLVVPQARAARRAREGGDLGHGTAVISFSRTPGPGQGLQAREGGDPGWDRGEGVVAQAHESYHTAVFLSGAVYGVYTAYGVYTYTRIYPPKWPYVPSLLTTAKSARPPSQPEERRRRGRCTPGPGGASSPWGPRSRAAATT